MGKPKHKDLDDEKRDQLYGGIQPEQLEASTKKLEELNSDKAELLGDISACMEAFDKLGGNKKAFKIAVMLKNMEEGKAQDLWRALNSYVASMGLFDQLDMFDQPAGGQAAAPVDNAETAH